MDIVIFKFGSIATQVAAVHHKVHCRVLSNNLIFFTS